MVKEHAGIVVREASHKTGLNDPRDMLRFRHPNFDVFPQTGTWQRGLKRMLLFQFDNDPNNLRLRLVIGPGPDRSSVIDWANKARGDVLDRTFQEEGTGSQRWLTIWTRHFLSAEDYEDPLFESILQKLRERWSEFIETDLPRIVEALPETR